MNSDSGMPAAVSKRNEFASAEELVEDALPFLPAQFQHENFRAWLIRYTETAIRRIAHHFAVGAARGIDQTAELLCDPEFYATRRHRRAKWRQQMAEQKAKQEWERIERLHCPTAEQIAQQIEWSERGVAFHRTELAKYEQNLERLRALVPKNIRLVPPKSVQ